MILEIKTYPNPVLKKIAEPVTSVTDALKELAENMVETMYEAHGVGLAAPQIGSSVRLIVMDCSDKRDDPKVFFNPVVQNGKGKIVDIEGCLSVPGVEAKVQRFENVMMTGLDINGKEISLPADGLWSRCFQHEIDHLEGILFIDRLSPLQRLKVKKHIEAMVAKV